MRRGEIPEPDKPLPPQWLKSVDAELRDVEFYGPTIPLHWSRYHAIIDRLVHELKKPQAGFGEGI